MDIKISKKTIGVVTDYLSKRSITILIFVLAMVSTYYWMSYHQNGLGLAYNDARSHLDIGRRVVEGLKPGMAQLGSVWLPLPHLLMVPTIWNDFMWHSGLAGALVSMLSFIGTGVLVYQFLKMLGADMVSRIFGTAVFVANINVLYLQSTAMTELLLMSTMTAAAYYFLLWFKNERILDLIKSSFFIMLATLVRYDGWFLILYTTLILGLWTWRKRGYKTAEGVVVLFCTLGGIGIVAWFVWNLLIFKDPLYFAFGPFSAHAQQEQLLEAGDLVTKGNLWLSFKTYMYALLYNSYSLPFVFAVFGAILLWFDKKIKPGVRLASTALVVPLMFNVLALYMGHSVLFVQGVSGDTWFNVRYGILLAPAISVFVGYLIYKARSMRALVVGLTVFVIFFAFANGDAVTIDDARVGSSQKNVSEVSGWLSEHTKDEEGYVLISAASHDAIIFSSGLSMSRFIHEGTGAYWESATTAPDRWARWIVMRTNDNNDLVFRLVSQTSSLGKYRLVESYPFADIYEIKSEYIDQLTTERVFANQK